MNTHFFGSVFFGGEFYFGAPKPIITIDMHDGGKKKHHKRLHDKEDKEQLHETIMEAIYGKAVADPVMKPPLITPIVIKEAVSFDDDEESLILLM